METTYTKVMEWKSETLWNAKNDEECWAEIERSNKEKERIGDEGEYYCPQGLFVVAYDQWEEIETFHVDEYQAFYFWGDRPVIHFFESENFLNGERGEVYDVEGGSIRLSSDGFSWEWIEEGEKESSRPRLVLLKPDEENSGENLWTNEFHDLWTALQAFDVREEGAEEMGGAILLSESFGLGIWKAIQSLPGFEKDSTPSGSTPIMLLDDQDDLYDLLENENENENDLDQICSW